MGKKKEGEDREKTLPQEIFGQAMISHGGEYASESAYGQALLRLGSTMERMATLQEVQTNLPPSSPPSFPHPSLESFTPLAANPVRSHSPLLLVSLSRC